MGIEYNNDFGIVTINCDGNNCFSSIEYKGVDCRCDVKSASYNARLYGWKISYNKDAIDWEHFCPSCKYQY